MKPGSHHNSRYQQSSDYPLPRKGPFNPFSDLSGIRPASEETSLMPSTAASFLYQPSKSESAGDRWVEEDVCFCQECRIARHEFSLSEAERHNSHRELDLHSSEREHPPSFRASPKFQDVPVQKEDAEGSLTGFLSEVGLMSLLPVLQEHEVTLEDLGLLTREDLADMRIPIGPRNRLLNALQKVPNAALNLSKPEVSPIVPPSDPELDSPKQHSAPNIKPASPEKPPRLPQSPPASDSSFQQHRKQLNDEVESFMLELDELLSRSQRKKPTTMVDSRPVELQASPVPATAQVSNDQMQLLKSLLSGREALEKGLESMQRSLSELKENRTSRDASPTPPLVTSNRASVSPKTKIPLNMKKGLINRLK